METVRQITVGTFRTQSTMSKLGDLIEEFLAREGNGEEQV